jgi:transposase
MRLRSCTTLHPVYRRLLTLTLEELRLLEAHLGHLDQQMADLLAPHHEAVQRLAEVPGLGVDSAQQIIAEVGVTAATFPSPRHLASWAGVCPGHEESAGINHNPRCPKGNRQMRRVLNQAANAAARAKGTVFAVLYRRLVARLGHAQAIGAIATSSSWFDRHSMQSHVVLRARRARGCSHMSCCQSRSHRKFSLIMRSACVTVR